MQCFIGIDLGSTTTKAVVLDENRRVLGKGITNSRSNYDTAAALAKQEALTNTRFQLFRQSLGAVPELAGRLEQFLAQFERDFRLEQFLEQLAELERTCLANADDQRLADVAGSLRAALAEIFRSIEDEASDLFAPGAGRKSDFFRDIAGSRYLAIGETVAVEAKLPY
ncbi:MAG: BadF/BadG/BcrA/BcrD ATPase family protein, partial [Alphaproteobacteria bacterium]|nr:BadF/BadG/BcrA/BcrD ATPase family protein [Alphaproteobacteria bacterium]